MQRRMSDLGVHPAAEIFPLMDGAEFDALVADIREHGLRDPIILIDGLILDGRNRYRACVESGVQPSTVEWCGSGTPEAFVVSKNLHRRHLTESQRAMIAGRIADARSGERTDLVQINTRSPVTATKAADMLAVSRPQVFHAKTVLQHGTPEEIASVDRGEAAVSTVATRVRKRATEAKSKPDDAPPVQRGIKVKLQPNKNMEETAREMLRLNEDEGISVVSLTEQFNMSQSTVSQILDIIAIATRDDLPQVETEIATKAVDLMNETRQPGAAYAMIAAISERLWGPAGTRRSKRAAIERARGEQFERAYGALTQACMAAAIIDVPHIDSARSAEVFRELKKATESVSVLREKIMKVWKS